MTTESDHPLIQVIKNSISDTIMQEYRKDFPYRHHLGASIIGHPCDRYLFYSFRWFMTPTEPSRVVRIFDRGHREEVRMLNMLRATGLIISTTIGELLTTFGLPVHVDSIDTVREWGVNIFKPYAHDFDPNGQIKANMPPHLGGSMDAVLHVPAEYVQELGYLMPIECKTHAEKYYKATFKKDLRESQPKHYSQANAYGYYLNATHAFYYGENKNNEDLDMKIVPLRADIVKLLETRAKNIVHTQDPKLIARTTEKWMCKACTFAVVCAKNLPPTSRNCRSCANFHPKDGGGWACMARPVMVERYAEITTAQDCPQYKAIQ